MVVPQRSPIDSEQIETRGELKSGLDGQDLKVYLYIVPANAPRGGVPKVRAL